MAKKLKVMKWVNWLVALMVGVAVGGLFIGGTTLGLPLLKYVPELVHTIVGWVVVVGTVVEAVKQVM